MSLGDTALEWVGPEKLTGTATAGTLAIFPVCRFSETRGTKASAVSPGKWFGDTALVSWRTNVAWGHSPRMGWTGETNGNSDGRDPRDFSSMSLF